MLIEQSGKDVIKKSFKIGVVLLMTSVIYCWMVGYLPRAEMLLTPHSARGAIILFCAILILIPSKLLGLGLSESLFVPNSITILSWFLGVVFLLLVFFILGFILSILIESIKNARRQFLINLFTLFSTSKGSVMYFRLMLFLLFVFPAFSCT